MKLTIMLIAMILCISRMKYYFKTGDKSLQGYFEYLKDKYWTKKQGTKPPTVNKDGYWVPNRENSPEKQEGQYTNTKCNRTVTYKDDYERWKEQRLRESAPDRPEYESKDGER